MTERTAKMQWWTPEEREILRHTSVIILSLVALFLVMCMLAGCSTYREHITTTTDTVITETTRTATVIGTGNRRDILGPGGIDSTHSQIPETITTIGAAAGEAAKAAVIP